jgi:hypothetical protein
MEAELGKLPGLGGMRLLRRAIARAERRRTVHRGDDRPALPVAAALI